MRMGVVDGSPQPKEDMKKLAPGGGRGSTETGRRAPATEPCAAKYRRRIRPALRDFFVSVLQAGAPRTD
jgi:hypothetical protein